MSHLGCPVMGLLDLAAALWFGRQSAFLGASPFVSGSP